MRLFRWVAAALLLSCIPAYTAFDAGEIICETTATTGTGTISLAGAVSNYATFVSQITSGATVPYHIRSGDGKLETGWGVFTDATPDTLTRTVVWSTDGSGTAISLSGTSTACVGPIADLWTGPNIDWPLSTGTGGSVTTGTIELGAATDTTVARSAAGEATIEGDAVKHAGKQMFWVGAGAFRNSALNPASCGDTYDSGTQDVTIPVCAFDTGATEENAEFGFAMPKASNESTITMQVAWTNTGGSSTQTVQWKIACTGFGDDDALNTAYPADVTVSDTWTAQNDYTLTAETSAITIQNLAENDYVNCRVGRDTSADDMSGDALLIGVKVYWTDAASTLAE